MGEDHIEEFTKGAEVKETVTLNPEENVALSVLLNIKLRKLEGESDFGGRRTDPELTKEEAQPLNEVYKQLKGKDHDVYKRVCGSTMPETDKHIGSNIIHIGNKERIAVSRLVDWELDPQNPGSRHLVSAYKETLLNLHQKLTVQNQPPAQKP